MCDGGLGLKNALFVDWGEASKRPRPLDGKPSFHSKSLVAASTHQEVNSERKIVSCRPIHAASEPRVTTAGRCGSCRACQAALELTNAMLLTVGARLGPYEILEPLGAGGMGEVYKARDTRLERIVAIKISREQFSERFEREARAVAALNHPHICQIYDVGPEYLVIEFVEGTALRGPLALKEAVEYAGQILDALDAAHSKGITHRDLKPANILVTKQGIKLLDFGLAKHSGPLADRDATLTESLTGKGAIVGTLQYVAPEHLHGKETDARSDLFSFGCVLYEMLTGKRAFSGGSTASVIAAILGREPAPLETAPPLESVVRRALAKDPDQRFQTARDLKAAMRWAMEHAAEPGKAPESKRVAWIAAAVLAVIAVVAIAGWLRVKWSGGPPPQPLVRLDVDLGLNVTLTSTGPDVVLSPDGTRLAYVSRGRLFTRRLDQPKATELAGTEGATAPFFSPDGQWIAFFTPNKLKKIFVEGGAAMALCDKTSTLGLGGSWGTDGRIVAALGNYVLSGLSAGGGVPTPLGKLAPGEGAQRWPQILPGGKQVMFTSYRSARGVDGATIQVLSLADGRRKTLHQGGTYGRYLPSGHLLYINEGTLFAVPFDVNRLEPRGTPVPVMAEVWYDATLGAAQLDFAQNGTLVCRSGSVRSATVQWLDTSGKMQPLIELGAYRFERLSPDGSRLALTSAGDIWVYDSRRDTMTRLTSGGGFGSPAWTPESQYLIFQSVEGLSWTRADGASKPQTLISGKDMLFPESLTADGKTLLYSEYNSERGYTRWIARMESEGAVLRAGKPQPLQQASFASGRFALSPDGRWLAYDSNESGSRQVYVRAFPDQAARWQISSAGGFTPHWSPNRPELFFRDPENQIMVSAYKVAGNSFQAEKPRAWSQKRFPNMGSIQNYGIAPDGRIAAPMPVEFAEDQRALNHVTFVLNFFDDLRRRVPSGK